VEILNFKFKMYQKSAAAAAGGKNQDQLRMIQENKPTWQASAEAN
jgi:hypothetical protein